MALATPQDRANLSSQSMLADYVKSKTNFIELARIVYTVIQAKMGSAPTAADMQPALSKVIRDRSTTYASMLKRRPFMNTALYDVYASALACILLDDEWVAIKS